MATMTFMRASAAAGGSVLMTFLMLLLMQALITSGNFSTVAQEPIQITPFLDVKEDQPLDTIKRLPEPPPVVEAQPDRVRPTLETGDVTRFGLPEGPSPPVNEGPGSSMHLDGDPTPLALVRPNFPSRARSSGWCVLSFDILATGYVSNAAVVECSHRVFAQSSLRAIQKSRFKPRMVNGVPFNSTGEQYRYVFELEG